MRAPVAACSTRCGWSSFDREWLAVQMEHVDGTLSHCNGHVSAGDSDDGSTAADRIELTGPQTPSSGRTTEATCGDRCRTSGYAADQQRRKLVLHFDVRNTILVSDSATHDSVEQALNSFLAGVTWGRHEPSGWVWYSDRPSLRAPCPDVITYYKSRERQLVRSPADRVLLRRVTGDFTRQPIGRKFRRYFEAHLRLLEWNVVHSSASICSDIGGDEISPAVTSSAPNEPTTGTKPEMVSVDRKLTIVGANGRLYHYLLPSFVKMLYDLHADGSRFSLILRTYGVDAPRVLDSIAHVVAGNHPLFPGQLPVIVNRRPGRIRRQHGGRIRCELPPSTDGTDAATVVLDTDADIYRYMSHVDGICGFVDDFRFWQENDYTHSDGKPLWIDFADPDVQHIFFDDNIRVADAEGIVDVRLFDDADRAATSGSGCELAAARSLSIEEIAPLDSVCLVQADLLECTSNVDYFINMVRLCRQNYSDYLQRHQNNHDRDV